MRDNHELVRARIYDNFSCRSKERQLITRGKHIFVASLTKEKGESHISIIYCLILEYLHRSAAFSTHRHKIIAACVLAVNGALLKAHHQFVAFRILLSPLTQLFFLFFWNHVWDLYLRSIASVSQHRGDVLRVCDMIRSREGE